MPTSYSRIVQRGSPIQDGYASGQYPDEMIYRQQQTQVYNQRTQPMQNSAYYPSRPQPYQQQPSHGHRSGQYSYPQPYLQQGQVHHNIYNMGQIPVQDTKQRQQPHKQSGRLPALPQHQIRQPNRHNAHPPQAHIVVLPSIFPKGKQFHKVMHTDHSEEAVVKAHPYYPEHMTTVRIRTPSRWGPSRIATPFEVRSTMTTEERYKLNPTKTKSQVGFDYEPYTHTDYKHMMSRYQNMYLPRGLGHTENARWRVEQEKRARMKSYSLTVKEMEQELRERMGKRGKDRPTTAAHREKWIAEV